MVLVLQVGDPGLIYNFQAPPWIVDEKRAKNSLYAWLGVI